MSLALREGAGIYILAGEEVRRARSSTCTYTIVIRCCGRQEVLVKTLAATTLYVGGNWKAGFGKKEILASS
jgi:hypothetical protein